MSIIKPSCRVCGEPMPCSRAASHQPLTPEDAAAEVASKANGAVTVEASPGRGAAVPRPALERIIRAQRRELKRLNRDYERACADLAEERKPDPIWSQIDAIAKKVKAIGLQVLEQSTAKPLWKQIIDGERPGPCPHMTTRLTPCHECRGEKTDEKE